MQFYSTILGQNMWKSAWKNPLSETILNIFPQTSTKEKTTFASGLDYLCYIYNIHVNWFENP